MFEVAAACKRGRWGQAECLLVRASVCVCVCVSLCVSVCVSVCVVFCLCCSIISGGVAACRPGLEGLRWTSKL